MIHQFMAYTVYVQGELITSWSAVNNETEFETAISERLLKHFRKTVGKQILLETCMLKSQNMMD